MKEQANSIIIPTKTWKTSIKSVNCSFNEFITLLITLCMYTVGKTSFINIYFESPATLALVSWFQTLNTE